MGGAEGDEGAPSISQNSPRHKVCRAELLKAVSSPAGGDHLYAAAKQAWCPGRRRMAGQEQRKRGPTLGFVINFSDSTPPPHSPPVMLRGWAEQSSRLGTAGPVCLTASPWVRGRGGTRPHLRNESLAGFKKW